MKKQVSFFLTLIFFLTGIYSYAQENLLDNSDFEGWNSGLGTYTPKDWDVDMSTTFRETTIKKSGNYSLQIKATKTNNYVEQEIRSGFTTGDLYELTIHYYVSTSVEEGKDIQIQSYWAKGGVKMDHDADKLSNANTFYTSVGKWKSTTIQTTVPTGATTFYFRIVIAKGGTVYFDDFSFKKVENLEPYLTITPETINKVNTTINTPVAMQVIHMETGNLPSAVNLDITGQNAGFFTHEIRSISETSTQGVYDIVVTYNPTTAGEHSAMLTIDCQEKPLLSKTLVLRGSATNPYVEPTLSYTPAALEEFSSKIGVPVTQNVLVNSDNLSHDITVKVMGEGEGSFTISTTLIPKNILGALLKITFNPNKVGLVTERIALTTTGIDTLFITVSGQGQPLEESGKEGDDYPLDISNPLVYLNETFDGVVHNEALSINKWKNIAELNTRAFWGYTFKDGNDNIIESTAKSTAFNSKVTEAVPYEMWLITPPLDYDNAASKMFTFRVMGDLLIENSDVLFELYYMDSEDGELVKEKIEIEMPYLPDHNKDWREFHVNLENQNLAEVFFMGFRFYATGGTANSATYYIDDVTFGRTEIPKLTFVNPRNIVMETKPDVPVLSEIIQITAENLSDSISLEVKGPNASKFAVPAKLSKTGGAIQVSFSSDLIGVHEAYIKVSSRGAADIIIPLSAKTDTTTSIDTIKTNIPSVPRLNNTRISIKSNALFIETESKTEVALFNISGTKLAEYMVYPEVNFIPYPLRKGFYLVFIKNEEGEFVHKVLIP